MSLKTHADPRGQLTEIFRNAWHRSPLPAQWIIVRSDANVLRGMHVHAHHWHFLCTVMGEICVGMHDARSEMAAEGRSAMLRLDSRNLHMLLVPPGVAHGYYAPVDAITLLGSSGLARSRIVAAADGMRPSWAWNGPARRLNFPRSTAMPAATPN